MFDALKSTLDSLDRFKTAAWAILALLAGGFFLYFFGNRAGQKKQQTEDQAARATGLQTALQNEAELKVTETAIQEKRQEAQQATDAKFAAPLPAPSSEDADNLLDAADRFRKGRAN